MRPDVLNPLFASATSLSGVGPRIAALMKKAVRLPAGITEPRVIDIIWHTPTGVIDRRAEPTVVGAVPGTIATFLVRVLKHKPSPRGNKKAPYRVQCEDDTGALDLVFFHADRRYVEGQLPVGEMRYVSGRVEAYGDKLQMIHPDYIVKAEARSELPLLEPVYPLTAGLSGKVLLKATRQAVELLPEVMEWQEEHWLKERGWPDFVTAIRALHQPTDTSDVSTGGAAWLRLAYDELLAGQLALALVRRRLKSPEGAQHHW